ncbi:MAG: CaiB/BaiF CoA transferase family protein [Myxococcota bacterium]|nr:carnitine dehydratase [Spirochaeta sp.]RPG12216.1 MAG: CoA transferase [Proteobacteria bacterium TMED72]
MAGPLEGIRVVDVSAVVSGPLCTMMLADQGAEVIKIESLIPGEVLRLSPFARGGLTSFYTNCNRNKRAIALDLTREEGLEVVLKLVRQADVFVQNWRPGAAGRLGLDEPSLRAINPELIYCSISGYGPDGPYSQRRVYDPIIQGLSGHAAVQINPQLPIRDLVRNIVADKSSAYTAAQAISAALFARERGQGGQHIQVPMIDASLAFFWADGMLAHTFTGDDPPGGRTLYETYRLSETQDGHLIYFVATDAEFHGLFRALGHPEWVDDPRFDTVAARYQQENAEALGEKIQEAQLGFTTEDLLERMLAEDVPCGPVLGLDEIFNDPQLIHNESILEFEHPTAGPYRQARPAARFDKTPQDPTRRMPPLHGEHTDEVLSELGYSESEIEVMREAGTLLEKP